MKQVKGNINMYAEIVSDNIKSISEIPEKLIDSVAEKGDTFISVFEKDKSIVYSTNKNIKKYYGDFKIDKPYIIKGNDNLERMVINKSFELKDKIYYIQVIKALKNENEYFYLAMIILGILNIIVISIIIKSGSDIGKKVVDPINEMNYTIKKINVQNLDTRINVKGSHDELRELAQTVNNMFDRIEQSYENQNRFVSDASHELRTPIAVIQGYANMLYRWGKDDKEVLEEAVAAIKGESENMKELVEKLLFLARVDKKSQKIHKEEFYINTLLDEIVRETKLIDSHHNIINKSNKNILVFADYKLLKQALRIFVDNSLKFTPKDGKIYIEWYINGNQVVITVEDTGLGIPKDDIPYIFDRFYRVDKSRTKDKGGSGLGLSIAKWIIKEHKGTIQVKSRVNVGTKISISIENKI
ncbi:HAMP domain-containing sensor histidine kinase [Clostridium sp. Marseille-Q2269]|uniref:sensor histidine kinase n=1 Tax=Clostridium sp. Marseille-Q2269 TaxID=2942205 RepID=UPI002074534D|nr:HAMP domain-containing sensor histidine kinase [Clostridium sp. Marseille-Q2269]